MMAYPYVIVNIASSLDGIIGSAISRLFLSCDEDWERVHNLRSTVDAIVVGVNTVIVDNPFLTVRGVSSGFSHPLRVIIDSSFRSPLSANIFLEQESIPTILFTSSKAPSEKIRTAKSMGVKIEFVEMDNYGLNLRQILSILTSYSVKRVLIEGGGRLISSFLLQNLVNELFVYYAPVFIGHQSSSVPLYNTSLALENEATIISNLKVTNVSKLGKGFLVHITF